MPNRLANESSAYLRQHADNPVDWYPWGPEALERARVEDRPILLSVGYSACHWCHVMEHESFASDRIAEQMNADFVCIKVDREERPDLDELYMQAVQAFTGGHGGWPMTVFLTPDGRPYFGGTYFPPTPRGRMPGFQQVLEHAAEVYRDHPEDVSRVTEQVGQMLQSIALLPAPAPTLGDDWLDRIAEDADALFDPVNGGFGGAPKFPDHGTLPALLAHWRRTRSSRSLHLLTTTLDQMARGGMADLLGGGFARYSVDAEWRVPHFEKMLYDNAQLVPVYLDAHLATGQASYARIAREALAYLERDLQLPDGGFAASQDADSEGEEGTFYVWTPAQLVEVAGERDGRALAKLLDVTPQGSFERGASVLRLATCEEELDEAERALWVRWRGPLLEARSHRSRPARDDKVVVAWNALAVAAFARAARALAEPRYAEVAAHTARFLWEECQVDGRLQRIYAGGQARIPGCLDDHANLAAALLELYEATFDRIWLERALELADRTVALFWDEVDGALFNTGHDAEVLLARGRRLIGGAEPSGNAVSALVFAKLDTLCGRADLGERAEHILRSLQAYVERSPRAVGLAALAAAWRTGDTREIALVGEPGSPDLRALEQVVRLRYDPFRVVAHKRPGVDEPLLPWTEHQEPIGGRATAYVCEGYACKAPTTDPAELDALLRGVEQVGQTSRVGETRPDAPALPDAASDWLNTSHPLTLSALRGNVVVLDFWTYCCINCLHVLPELAALEEEFATEPVVVIGVHAAKFPTEQQRDSVLRAVRRHGVRHPVVLDPHHTVWERYEISSWPTVVLLDTRGRIARVMRGEVDRNQLAAAVRGLLDEAREARSLSAPVWTRSEQKAKRPARRLRVPGKVGVWPDAAAQVAGAPVLDAETRLYVSDTGHHRIIEAALERGEGGWPVATVRRTFDQGFFEPQGVSRHGNQLWVADTGNHQVQVVDLRSGQATVKAGTGQLGRSIAVDPTQPTTVALRSPWDVIATEGVSLVAMAGSHQLWLYATGPNRFAPFIGDGTEAHVDGAPAQSALAQPSGMALFGRLLVWADAETSSIRLFDFEQREVSTLVGKGLFDFGDADGAASEALLQHPLAVAFDGRTVYVADTFNHKIKAISLQPGFPVRTLAGGDPEDLCEPGGLAIAGEFLVIADTNNHRLRAMHRESGELRDLPLRWE